jgi:hypothetical protein
VHVEINAANGRNIYCDRDEEFANLPPALLGADWVQTAHADAFYSAADLMQLEVNPGTSVYIAHDGALSLPQWIRSQFQPTNLTFNIHGRPMTVFKYSAAHQESLTLGSNTSGPRAHAANMYIVFIQGK